MTTLDVLEELAPVPPLADVPFGPTPPAPPTDGLRPAVRAMVAELAEHYKGADPGSIDKAVAAMKPLSTSPTSWESRGQVANAVKAYRASISGTAGKTAAKKAAVRTATAKPRRTAVRPAAPVAVQEPDRTVVQPTAVPSPPPVVQPNPVPPAAVRTAPVRRAVVWPVVLLAAPAFVAIWSGWVGLGGLTGFGIVHPLPGIWDGLKLNTAITLPVGVETYGAYALYVWLSGRVPDRARRFAKWSAIASLAVGALGQVAYHLLAAHHVTSAPWQITTAVSCLPVAVLGMGAALAHLVREER